ncbi:hypothetical protein C8A00DRAFT_19752, partial [Chaetomidium leptoderma]
METLEGQPTQPTVRRRRRPALSCRECRRRKVRCDHNSPCAHCIRHKTQCVYKPFRDHVPTTRPVASGTGTGTGTGTSAAIGASGSSRGTTEPTETPPSPSQMHILERVTATRSVFVEPSLADLVYRIERPKPPNEALVSRTPTGDGDSPTLNAQSEADRDPDPDPLAPQRACGPPPEWQPILNKPRDWGRSRWVGGAPQFAAIMACYSEITDRDSKDPSFQNPETAALVAQAGEFLRKCKTGAKNIKVGRPTRGPGPTSSPVSFTLPPREKADEKAELYFSSFESTHRILHAPTFWAEYQKYWDQPESVTEDLRLKILLVIGIGSSLHDHGDVTATQRNTELVQQWIYAAQTWLSGFMEKNRLDLAGLQIHCLTILARQIFSIGGDTVWVSMGSLVHGAMQIGLHRDPKHLPAMSVLHAELRRRLWATVMELIVQASLVAWMPPRISLDEFDTEPPFNINDDEINESTTVLQPHSKDTFTSTSIQLAMLDSLPTRLRIVQLLNSLHSERSYRRVLALTAELTSTLQACATRFASAGSGSGSCTTFHRNILDYLTRRFLIPLHFPFSHQARTNPLFHYSVKVSLDAALALVSPEQDNNGMFARLIVIGGGLFRDGIRSATVAIGLELLGHVETQRSDGSLHRTRQCRTYLKQVVRDLVALAEDRIRQGETNVKSHMFLSMVLAQVEAVEETGGGEAVDLARRLARAARDSLGFCEGLV